MIGNHWSHTNSGLDRRRYLPTEEGFSVSHYSNEGGNSWWQPEAFSGVCHSRSPSRLKGVSQVQGVKSSQETKSIQ